MPGRRRSKRRAPKVAVVHIGTHKTGTTSLQSMIARNWQFFSEQGVFYPTSGRVSDAHHNLAWELNRDERFHPDRGALEDLVEELRQLAPRSVLLSSEDFEYLYPHPVQLARMRQSLEQFGYAVRVVVVLRNPADYLESLYSELLKHGLDEDLDVVVADALRQGGINFGVWDFRLDYEQLVQGFARTFDARAVHVVSYDPNDSVDSVLGKCGELLRLRIRPIAGWERFNTRLDERETSVGDDFETARIPGGTADNDRRVSLTTAEREALEETFGRTLDRLVGSPQRPRRKRMNLAIAKRQRSDGRALQQKSKSVRAEVCEQKDRS